MKNSNSYNITVEQKKISPPEKITFWHKALGNNPTEAIKHQVEACTILLLAGTAQGMVDETTITSNYFAFFAIFFLTSVLVLSVGMTFYCSELGKKSTVERYTIKHKFYSTILVFAFLAIVSFVVCSTSIKTGEIISTLQY